MTEMTLSDLARTPYRLRCRLGRARTPLESDSLQRAAEFAVQLAKLRGWAS